MNNLWGFLCVFCEWGAMWNKFRMSFTDCEERNDSLTKPHSSLGVQWVNIGNDDGHKSGLWIMFSLLPRTPHLASNNIIVWTVCNESRPWCTLSEHFSYAVGKCHTNVQRETRGATLHLMRFPAVRGQRPELPCPPHTETYRRQATRRERERGR